MRSKGGAALEVRVHVGEPRIGRRRRLRRRRPVRRHSDDGAAGRRRVLHAWVEQSVRQPRPEQVDARLVAVPAADVGHRQLGRRLRVELGAEQPRDAERQLGLLAGGADDWRRRRRVRHQVAAGAIGRAAAAAVRVDVDFGLFVPAHRRHNCVYFFSGLVRTRSNTERRCRRERPPSRPGGVARAERGRGSAPRPAARPLAGGRRLHDQCLLPHRGLIR